MLMSSQIIIIISYYYYYYHYHRISHFSASAGKHPPILGYAINRIRLDGLIYSLKSFFTIDHVPRITDFCIFMYVFGCRLNLFRLCDSDFGITPIVTNGITWAVFCFHIAHISFASSWYLFCLSVTVLARLCLGQLCLSERCSLFSYWWMLYQVD